MNPILIKSILILLFTYSGWRLIFFCIPQLKISFFINPAGLICYFFWGNGYFNGTEWIYYLGDSRLVLGELCSGTTFFYLLLAYMVMRYAYWNLSIWWVVACYPICIVVNAARVLSSFYISSYLNSYLPEHTTDYAHLAVGSITDNP